MQLHLKCILIASLYAAGCHQNNGNSSNSAADTNTTVATETTTATSNGTEFKKQAALAFLSKSGADTLRKIDIQLGPNG